jgi:predicted nucleotidyltransferase
MAVNDDLMEKQAALQIIQQTLSAQEILIKEIIVFGSRARGDYHKESDWDFLVVTDQDLSFKEKHQLIIQIKRRLAKSGIPNDIIIQSRTKFNTMKHHPGSISYVANLEGIPG